MENYKEIDVLEDEGVLTSLRDKPKFLPTRPELVEPTAERNSNRRVIAEWALGGLASVAAGVAVMAIAKPRRHHRSRFA